MAGNKDSSWDDIKNEGIDLVSILQSSVRFPLIYIFQSFTFNSLIFGFQKQEKIPIEEVLTQLRCTREGLTSDEGQTRLEIFGPNKLEEKKAYILNPFHFFFCFFTPKKLHLKPILNKKSHRKARF